MCDFTKTEKIEYRTVQNSCFWERGNLAPKMAKATLSGYKIMATLFWDVRGVIDIDNVEKGEIWYAKMFYIWKLGTYHRVLRKMRVLELGPPVMQ